MIFGDQEFASLPFVLDQARHNLADFRNQGGFVFAKSCLVADLIEVPHELRSFAEQSTDCDIDFVQSPKNFVNLFGCDQCGQMKHHTYPQTRTYIGWTGSKVPQSLRKGVSQLAFELIVELVHALPCGLQVQATLYHLDTQVILFIDHDAEALVGIQDDGTGTLAFVQLMADQLSFHQKLAIEIT